MIGIAGGAEKCRWLTDICKLDAAIDYKSEPVAKQLAELCPDGIDFFFDNVGGEMLQAAIDNMAPFGRIALCGQISSYNDDKPPEGPRNMMRLIYGSITMQGFLSRNYANRFPEAIKDLRAWTASGQRTIVLLADVDTLVRFCSVTPVTKVNLGGIHGGENRTECLPYVFVSQRELEQLRDLSARGIEITAQDVPTARAIALEELAR